MTRHTSLLSRTRSKENKIRLYNLLARLLPYHPCSLIMKYLVLSFLWMCGVALSYAKKYNVLFIISDDLTYTALSCYGNKVCKTPNIDKLASEGVRFTQAYCQGTYCGPSRASFMSGYYPHATRALGYKSPRAQIGDRSTWSQHFR